MKGGLKSEMQHLAHRVTGVRHFDPVFDGSEVMPVI
jgi:hypothetical protein